MPIPAVTQTIVISMTFCVVVSAHALKWNKAGKVKAIGVQVRAPVIERKRSSLSLMMRATTQDMATMHVLVKFLHNYRLRVLGHDPNRYDSMMRLAGWITSGYEKIRLKLKAILTR